jgi:hypothetical protein
MLSVSVSDGRRRGNVADGFVVRTRRREPARRQQSSDGGSICVETTINALARHVVDTNVTDGRVASQPLTQPKRTLPGETGGLDGTRSVHRSAHYAVCRQGIRQHSSRQALRRLVAVTQRDRLTVTATGDYCARPVCPCDLGRAADVDLGPVWFPLILARLF